MIKFIVLAIGITTLFGGCSKRSWGAERVPFKRSYDIRPINLRGTLVKTHDIHGEYYAIVPRERGPHECGPQTLENL